MSHRWSESDLKSRDKRLGTNTKIQAAAASDLTPVQRMQALGRLPKGTMNKTESRYAAHLDAEMLSGEILWYKFEAIKFMLAPNTSITVDFAIMRKTGVLEMHDVKAAKHLITDDAKAKMKIAAADFPFVFCYVYPESKSSHNWIVQEV